MERVRNRDTLLYLAIVLFCFLVFQHGDLIHIGLSAFGFVDGHFLDFYDYNFQKRRLGPSYFPSTYSLFALWNLPVKWIGTAYATRADFLNATRLHVILWWKLLMVLFFVLSAHQLYKVGRLLGGSASAARMLAIIWITTPIALYSQFIFGQTDILTVFFTLVGLRYYLEEKLLPACLWAGVAITFKYFPVFVFVPLLFLAEKNPRKLFSLITILLLPVGLQWAIYARSPAFQMNVLGHTLIPNPLGNTWDMGKTSQFNLLTGVWVFVCALSYAKGKFADRKSLQVHALYVATVVVSVLFTFLSWNPQWLLFLTPFLAITTWYDHRARYFLISDIFMMVAFLVFSIGMRVGEELLTYGILGKSFIAGRGHLQCGYFQSAFASGAIPSIAFSAFVAILLTHVVLKWPREELVYVEGDSLMGVVRARLLIGTLIFIIPMIFSYAVCVGQ